MPTNKDLAIAHGITRKKIVKTFHKNTKVQSNGCIVWTKSFNENGYGHICIKPPGKLWPSAVYVHRFAWALKHGMDALPIGSGSERKGDRMVLNHICYNRLCVNTNHLEVILQSENVGHEKRKPKRGA